jgi:putative oxidoreductase
MWNLVYALGRVALVALFFWSAAGKLMAPASLNAALSAKGVPMPMLVTYAGAVVEIVCAILILIGWKTRYAALGLILFTIAATYVSHDFWAMTGQARIANQAHFFKNLSIIGGLMLLMAAGAGRYSVERR